MNDVTLFKNCVNFLIFKGMTFIVLWKYFHNMKKHTMKNNQELQTDVQNAIKSEPFWTSEEIGVTAKDNIVSLTSVIDRYAIDIK